MENAVTIVTYHYVRHIQQSRFPEIKGLETTQFDAQIQYIKSNYNVISAHQLLDAVRVKATLPPRALLLTFDDGYLDHFTQVFPILDRERLPGCFFPSAQAVLENRVLDVNKIHFILAATSQKQVLVDEIARAGQAYAASFPDELIRWDADDYHNRFDTPEVSYIKRMLQRDLPKRLRDTLIAELFGKYVSADEAAFARELYMSIEQVACLQRNGMYVGSHGYSHCWLDQLDAAAQANEIDLSLKFLDSVGSPTDNWIMCYPYGIYDDTTLELIRARGCVIGLSTRSGVANLSADPLLLLPRLDTNELTAMQSIATMQSSAAMQPAAHGINGSRADAVQEKSHPLPT